MQLGFQPNPEKIYSVNGIITKNSLLIAIVRLMMEIVATLSKIAFVKVIIKQTKEEPNCGDCGQELTLVRQGNINAIILIVFRIRMRTAGRSKDNFGQN